MMPLVFVEFFPQAANLQNILELKHHILDDKTKMPIFVDISINLDNEQVYEMYL